MDSFSLSRDPVADEEPVGPSHGRQWDLDRSVHLLDTMVARPRAVSTLEGAQSGARAQLTTSTPAVPLAAARRPFAPDLTHEDTAIPLVTPDRTAVSLRAGPGMGRPQVSELSAPETFLTGRGNPSTLYQSAVGQTTVLERTLAGRTKSDSLAQGQTTQLTDDDRDLISSEGLYQQFHETFSSPSSADVCAMLTTYQELLAERAEALSKAVSAKQVIYGNQDRTQGRQKEMRSMHQLLDGEQWTWCLLATLFKDVLAANELEMEKSMDDSFLNPSEPIMDDHGAIAKLYETNGNVRRLQIVVDWLETMAADRLETQYIKLGYLKDRAGASWENTLHTLKQSNSGPPRQSQVSYVTEMDPDAPIRQGKSLHQLDADDEKCFQQLLFTHIRCGKLAQAQDLCVRAGQAWRAASLEGWRLHHDPNLDYDKELGLCGNMHRDVWKRMCWEIAHNEDYDPMERATYGAMCGGLRPLLAVCPHWEDSLWAYTKVLVDCEVETRLRLVTPPTRAGVTLVDMPQEYWSNRFPLARIFSELEASPSSTIREECDSFHRMVQKMVILGQFPELMDEMAVWARDPATPGTLIRFMAHLVLFFKKIGRATMSEEAETVVLRAYVTLLIKDKRTPLIATYAAVLPAALRTDSYCQFMEGVSGTEARENCLHLAYLSGLNCRSLTKALLRRLRAQYSPHVLPLSAPDTSLVPTDLPSSSSTTQEDSVLIDAVEWLTLDPEQSFEAVYQGCAIMRTFLALRKLQAARELFNRLPSSCVHYICQGLSGSEGTTAEDPAQARWQCLQAAVVKEYFCIKAYLDAQDSFSDWFEVFYHQKPLQPGRAQAQMDFAQRVAYDQQKSGYEDALRRWDNSQATMTKVALERLYNVLLFPRGGWMVDPPSTDVGLLAPGLVASDDEGSEDGTEHHRGNLSGGPVGGDASYTEEEEGRGVQMEHLRRLCIPTTVTLLHKILTSVGQHKECLRLADLLASEQHQLYKVYTKGELGTFLKSLHQCCVALLDQDKDALGYDLSSYNE